MSKNSHRKFPQKDRASGFSPANFLVSSAEEMAARGWKGVDIIIVSGDAYVDHPSFGTALIGRWLEKLGYRVAILAQPDWRSVEPFRQLGPPNLFWGITSGAVDSRLNTYSSLGHKRRQDAYSPGGKTGLRPDKPLLTYAARAREAYKGIPVILGGLEASLRRLAHYDYIEDKLKRSILIDAKADLLVYGMAEQTIAEIAARLAAGRGVNDLLDIPGVAYPLRKERPIPDDALEIPGLDLQQTHPDQIMQAQIACQNNMHPAGKPLLQSQGRENIILNPPPHPITPEQLDALYDLPFTRAGHPRYDREGGIPALQTVQFSIVSHRGCFGGCSFCSLFFHQGKHITSRSAESLLNEAELFTRHPDFRGTIQDIGGPSANMYGMSCTKAGGCTRPSCIHPNICPHLQRQYNPQLNLLEQFVKWSRQGKKKNAFIASGVRHDLALWDDDYLDMLIRHFVGGHLKVAPEHLCPRVLSLMGKPTFDTFLDFEDRFYTLSRRAGKEQYLVPYFISAHPGTTTRDALQLCEYLVDRRWRLRQVQDFTPIPLTLSTAMYASGRDPTQKPLHIPTGRREKRLQMALLKFHEKENARLIRDFLKSNQSGLSPKKADRLLAQITHQQNR